MRLTVISRVDSPCLYWVCRDSSGDEHRVDLVVCGSPDKDAIMDSVPPFVVDVGYLFPYIELCNECKLVKETDA